MKLLLASYLLFIPSIAFSVGFFLEGGADFTMNNHYGLNVSMGSWASEHFLPLVSFDGQFIDSDNSNLRLSLQSRYYLSEMFFVAGDIGIGDWYLARRDNFGVAVAERIGIDFGGFVDYFKGISVSLELTQFSNPFLSVGGAILVDFGGSWGRGLFSTAGAVLDRIGAAASAGGGSSGSVELQIDGEFTGWTGNTVFRFTNGETWQQTGYSYVYHYAYSPRVFIAADSGGYTMSVEGMTETIRVRRLS